MLIGSLLIVTQQNVTEHNIYFYVLLSPILLSVIRLNATLLNVKAPTVFQVMIMNEGTRVKKVKKVENKFFNESTISFSFILKLLKFDAVPLFIVGAVSRAPRQSA